MNTQYYDLSIIPSRSIVKVHASQWDSGERSFAFTLYNESGLYTIPTGSTIELRGTKADGHGYDITNSTNPNQISFDGAVVTVTPDTQMCAAAGEQDFKIGVRYGGTLIASARFTLVVDADTLADDTDISDSEIPAIIDLANEQLRQATYQAQLAKSYAKGHSESGRTDENTDNAEYYKELAKYYSEHVSVREMTGASASADGESGTVPKPLAGDQNKFLRGDGSWAVVKSNGAYELIAPIENTSTSTREYAVGEQFIYNDILYTATALIAIGDTITPNTNCKTSDSLTEQIKNVQPDFDDLVGATAYTDGSRGLAPQPLAGEQNTFLSGGGDWEQNTTNLNSSFPSTDEITAETTDDGFTGYKNVLTYPFYESTVTRNGVTFTDNGDGSVTTSGTSTAFTSFNIKSRLDTSGASTIPNGKYVLTGCPTGGSDSTYYIGIQYRKNDINYIIGRDTGSGYAFELKGDDYSADEVRVILQIVVNNGTNSDGLIFRPMISPIDVSDENLITYPFYQTTKTENGLTFTDNGDGTVTVNGTATATTNFLVKSRQDESGASTIPNGTYYLSGCPLYGHTNSYRMAASVYKNGSTVSVGHQDVGNGTQIVLSGDDYGEDEVRLTLQILISSGVTVDNLTFAPKLQRIYSDESYVAPHTVPTLTSGETHQSLFGKISAMFKNIRKLWNTVGTAEIPPELGTTITEVVANKVYILIQNGNWRTGIREKNLGTSFTDDQKTAIAAGDFTELWNGDYWTINSRTCRIVDNTNFQYRKGDTEFTKPGLIIMYDNNIVSAEGYLIDNANDSGHGYANCAYRTRTDGKGRAYCKSLFTADFGSDHIATHRELMSTSRGTGGALGWGWQDADVELPSEVNLYGHSAWGCGLNNAAYSSGYNISAQWGQFKLFELKPVYAFLRQSSWLRDVVSASNFAYVTDRGNATSTTPSATWRGLRPYAILV